MVKEIPESQRGIKAVAKELINEFSEDDVMTQSAAVAFYTGLALAPVLTVAVWLTKAFFPGDSKERIIAAFESVLGYQAAYPIREMLDPAAKAADTGMNVAGIISLCLVLFSASGVFAQLQSALNLIWDVEAKPSAGGVWAFIRKRFLSFGMLLTILFLLLTSLIVSTVIQGMIGVSGDEASRVAAVINFVVSLGIYVLLFAAMFRYLPDVRIDWKDVWVGATITAVLFAIGKWGLGVYLGRTAPPEDMNDGQSDLYARAVGSFVAFLLWVYYSGIIVLIGAEATQIFTRHKGHGFRPNKYSQLIEKKKEPIPTDGTPL